MPLFPLFLIQVIGCLLIIGVLLWIVTKLPIDAGIRETIKIVVYGVTAIWLIYLLMAVLSGKTPLLF